MNQKKILKDEIIAKLNIDPKNTGCPEIQVTGLTYEIKKIASHLANNKNDKNSTRGLMMQIGQRKKMLQYLKSISEDRYNALINALGLRK